MHKASVEHRGRLRGARRWPWCGWWWWGGRSWGWRRTGRWSWRDRAALHAACSTQGLSRLVWENVWHARERVLVRRTGDAARQDVAVRLEVPRPVEAQVTVVGFLIPGKDAGVVVWSQSLARVGRFGAAQHPVTSRGPFRRVRNGVPLVDAPCSCGTLGGDREQRSSQSH